MASSSMGGLYPSTADPIQSRPSTLPLSIGSSGSIKFFTRISRIPLADTILQAYRWAKASSEVLKYGAEMMESSTTTILRPVINQLPITKLDDFACRQLDKFGWCGDSPGPPRFRDEIVGGFIIPYAEAVAWVKRVHGGTLNPDHSQDLSIPWYLSQVIHDHSYPYDIEQVRPQGARLYDTLLVTQWAGGNFVNAGPPGVEEVLQDNLKEILKPGPREDEAREIIFQELGITMTGFKCYFSVGTCFTARVVGEESHSNNESRRKNKLRCNNESHSNNGSHDDNDTSSSNF